MFSCSQFHLLVSHFDFVCACTHIHCQNEAEEWTGKCWLCFLFSFLVINAEEKMLCASSWLPQLMPCPMGKALGLCGTRCQRVQPGAVPAATTAQNPKAVSWNETALASLLLQN